MTHPGPTKEGFERALTAGGLSDEVHDYDFISGLLLALASGPDLVSPSEWLPLVYLDEENQPAFASERAFGDFFGELMLLWNHWNDELESPGEALAFPSRYCLEQGETPSEPLSHFARGVAQGYAWLQEDWDNLFDEMGDAEVAEEIDGIYGLTLLCAMVLVEPQRIQAAIAEEGNEAPSPGDALAFLTTGLKTLANVGRSLSAPEYEEDEAPFMDPMRQVGRNDPCPCGSGKKYKKCCLN